jgi:hypothetical protein
MRSLKPAAALTALIFLNGCATPIPPAILSLPVDHLEKRKLQSRQYETTDEEKILSACTGVLQDLGFTIDKGESKLGVIFASKDRKVDNGGQIVAATLLTALAAMGNSGYTHNYYNDVERDQKIRAAIVTQKTADGSKVLVRVSFQRLVWKTSGVLSRIETLKEPDLYMGFYSSLSKAVFLEEHFI